VTRDQAYWGRDTGYTAAGFDLGYSLFEQTLSKPGSDDRLPFSGRDGRILGELTL
jgi:hypothetical protein